MKDKLVRLITIVSIDLSNLWAILATKHSKRIPILGSSSATSNTTGDRMSRSDEKSDRNQI
jgi:hypothetical protein